MMTGTKLSIAALMVVCVSWSSSAWAYTTLYNCRSAWPSADLPVPYHVTEDTPSALPDIEQIRRIYRDSFDAWSEPCCSNFAATDAGTTTASGENNSDDLWTITILEDSWPRTLGDASSTLGVTLTMVDGACWIVGSDVVFNAYTWTFVDGTPHSQVEADLVSIATHEFGHFLGLGHTSVYGATMYPAYSGGTSLRSLHQDDIDGVCYLYEQACACTTIDDCTGDEECIDDVCQVPPCESHSDCDTGLICDAFGDCVVPPCDSDGDCLTGYICDDSTGACVPNADCPICAECTANADCGVNGICIPAGYIGASSACTAWCNSSADCPGNTECFTVPTQDGDVNLCFNSDADTAGPCPTDFVCLDDGTNLCEGVSCDVGETCNPATGQCQGASSDCVVCETCSGTSTNECGTDGACLGFVGGPTICSVPCGVDGSCPGDSTCFELQDESGSTENWCLNSNAATAGICPTTWVCDSGTTDLCEDVVCEGDQYCNAETGLCEGGGGGDTSDAGTTFPDVTNPDEGGTGVTPTGQTDGGNTIGGCGCRSVGGTSSQSLWALLFLGLLAVVRRR